MNWSKSFPVFGSNHHLGISGDAGVYRIRVFTSNGRPQPIQRFAGLDPDGILHIGKSNDLGRRIRTFRQATEGLKAMHHAGREFYFWQFVKHVPYQLLQYDYHIASSEREALKLERLLHEEYRRKFLDRPPLDGTSGQKGT